MTNVVHHRKRLFHIWVIATWHNGNRSSAPPKVQVSIFRPLSRAQVMALKQAQTLPEHSQSVAAKPGRASRTAAHGGNSANAAQTGTAICLKSMG
ncbi:hypothetical protein QIY50_11445 [Pseudomonas putida]|nr:hypothetical protein QIY50_11445 [Pseudomonas putida]